MAIGTTPVQDKTYGHNSGSSSDSFTMTSTPTNGNVLILVAASGGTTKVTGLSQTGVTWSSIKQSAVNKYNQHWMGTVGAGASTTVNVTYDNSSGSVNIEVSEWSGLPANGGNESSNSTSGSSTNPASSSLTPTASRNALFIGSTQRGAGSVTAGPTNSFTSLASAGTPSLQAYLVVTSTTGSYSVDWTVNASSTWDGVISSYLATAATGAGLFRESGTDGLGSGGPFFHDPTSGP